MQLRGVRADQPRNRLALSGAECQSTPPASGPSIRVRAGAAGAAGKVSGPGLLTVDGSSTGDWAIEIRDPKGNSLGGDDKNPPSQESASAELGKGTWTVYYCNLTGAPTATATYSFVYH